MNRARAIKLKCLDCSSISPKEVTLCHIFDCTLWPYRTGASPRSVAYKQRMQAAKKNYTKDFEEMTKLALEYFENMPEEFKKFHLDLYFSEEKSQ